MSDKDDLLARGITCYTLVDELGVSTDGTSTSLSVLRSRGFEPICEVNSSGVASSGSTLTQMRSRGIRVYCAVTENAVTSDAVSLTTLRSRGIYHICPVDVNGIAMGGTATLKQLAAKGITGACLVNSTGTAVTPGSPYTLVASTGSFIMTGDAMTPLVDYKIPAAVGAFTLTGQAATLTASTSDAAETTAFLARTSGLNGTETAAYKTLINGLVADGLFTGVLDALYIFATNTTTTANLNLVSTSYGLTQQGTVTFTADTGYTGNGSTGYFTTGYTPSTASGAMTLNSASLGVYVRTNRTSTGNDTAICAADASNISYIAPLGTGPSVNWDVNGSAFPGASNSTAQGAWVASRTATTTNKLYRNGSSTAVGSSANTGNALITQPFVIGAYNNNGSIIFHSTDQLSAAWWGRGVTGAESVTINNRINAFMTSLGVNVY